MNTSPDSAATPPQVPAPRLTARQLEVLSLLCEGLSNKAISRRLAIKGTTVKVHVGAILRELRVHNRLQAVLAARRLGFWCESPQAGAAALARVRRALEHGMTSRHHCGQCEAALDP